MIIRYDPFPIFHTSLSKWYLPDNVYSATEVKEPRAVRRLRNRLKKGK